MSEEKMNYVEYIKNIYFSKPFLAKECELELIRPRFNDLLFGFINGSVKTMAVYDKESDIRLEY